MTLDTDALSVPRALQRAGRWEEALAWYDAAAKRERFATWPRLEAGHALRTLGRTQEAIECFRHALALRPHSGAAWWALANLKTYRLTARDADTLADAVADPRESPGSQALASFALGKYHEDAREWNLSARAYSAANALYANRLPWEPDAHSAEVARARETYTRAWFEARSAAFGDPSPAPIFILGLPRSGSTLLEQMLGSHSAIEATIEHPDLWTIGRRLTTQHPQVVSELEPDDARALGGHYLRQIAPHRRTDKPYFIDKLPDNWLYVALIHVLLPNARIIDMRRERRAAGFANWKQCFGHRGYRWTYEQLALGRYVRDYETLMAHFDQVAPWRVTKMSYERLVAQPELELRALCAELGLPFEARMLEYWRLERPMRTASSEQVKRPIYTDALEVWRHYAPSLQVLLGVLE
jgi:tetratricopeptide (TPR) repeat protein